MLMIHIIGGGLAGSEAAWQAAERGVPVTLHEMRPVRATAVHKTDQLAELVCSNSFRGDKLDNAVGLLKEEMRRLGSLIMRAADGARVPAGAALAVDRERFFGGRHRRDCDPTAHHARARGDGQDSGISRRPAHHRDRAPDVRFTVGRHRRHGRERSPVFLRCHQPDRPCREHRHVEGVSRVAVGAKSTRVPGALGPGPAGAESKGAACGVDDGEGDYLNCPFTADEYARFYEALMAAERAPLHDFDEAKFFEGCLPIEVMASRGVDTLRFGPMKPVGLVDPRTGREAYAVVQLRQDNLAGDHFSLVGFQTQMKWGEQARVLKLIPGLEQAEFVRFGMIHRNTYINGPTVLRETWQTQDARRPVFRGTDFRRRGIRGIGGVGAARRAQRRGAGARRAHLGAAADDRDRRARVLRVARGAAAITSRPTSRSASCRRSCPSRADGCRGRKRIARSRYRSGPWRISRPGCKAALARMSLVRTEVRSHDAASAE